MERLYHGLVNLAQDVLAYIRKHALLKAGNRVGLAVSGGADSVALLRLLLELRSEIGMVLSVVHFNHQLRGADSDQDEEFVAQLARQYKLEMHFGRGDVADFSARNHLSIEAAARKMRYEFFRGLLLQGRLSRIATAHTLDDQAETVLLRVTRGAGNRGLAGIYPQLAVAAGSSIVRPLLGAKRQDLEAYLKSLGQLWREDASNRDLRHTRNRVRHGILPRLERNLNPRVREALAETAEIARAEEDYWEQEVARVLPKLWNPGFRALDRSRLANAPLALRRRIVRAVAESLGLRLEFRHVEDVLALAQTGDAPVSAMLPEGWVVSHHQTELRFEPPNSVVTPPDYEYRLPVPGTIDIPEIRFRFEAVLVSGNAAQGYNPEQLLDRVWLGEELIVRNWRPGDRFWPPHTKGPKKVKELLQERHLTGTERKHWPVVASASEVVWVSGFAVPARLRPRDETGTAVAIREIPLHAPPKL
jgi:tRNA(Ile)-lysidine synthase